MLDFMGSVHLFIFRPHIMGEENHNMLRFLYKFCQISEVLIQLSYLTILYSYLTILVTSN